MPYNVLLQFIFPRNFYISPLTQSYKNRYKRKNKDDSVSTLLYFTFLYLVEFRFSSNQDR